MGYFISLLLYTIIPFAWGDNFCPEKASFDEVHEWLQWKAKAIALAFTSSYTKLESDLVVVVNAIAGVRSAIQIIVLPKIYPILMSL